MSDQDMRDAAAQVVAGLHRMRDATDGIPAEKVRAIAGVLRQTADEFEALAASVEAPA